MREDAVTNEPASIDMKEVWQSQTAESVRMSAAELRQRSQKLSKKVFWRNVREYVAAAFVVAAFGDYIWKFHAPLIRLGSGLIIAGALYYVYQLHARGSARVMPPAMALDTCLEFHRKELERQRDLVRSVWSWAMLPMVPGMVAFLLGGAVAQGTASPGHAERAVVILGVRVAIVFAVWFAVWKLNQRAARKLQLKIDTLIALEKESK
jgi:hypothetical protein